MSLANHTWFDQALTVGMALMQRRLELPRQQFALFAWTFANWGQPYANKLRESVEDLFPVGSYERARFFVIYCRRNRNDALEIYQRERILETIAQYSLSESVELLLAQLSLIQSYATAKRYSDGINIYAAIPKRVLMTRTTTVAHVLAAMAECHYGTPSIYITFKEKALRLVEEINGYDYYVSALYLQRIARAYVSLNVLRGALNSISRAYKIMKPLSVKRENVEDFASIMYDYASILLTVSRFNREGRDDRRSFELIAKEMRDFCQRHVIRKELYDKIFEELK